MPGHLISGNPSCNDDRILAYKIGLLENMAGLIQQGLFSGHDFILSCKKPS